MKRSTVELIPKHEYFKQYCTACKSLFAHISLAMKYAR